MVGTDLLTELVALDVANGHFATNLCVQMLEERQGVGLMVPEYLEPVPTLPVTSFEGFHRVTCRHEHGSDLECVRDAVDIGDDDWLKRHIVKGEAEPIGGRTIETGIATIAFPHDADRFERLDRRTALLPDVIPLAWLTKSYRALPSTRNLTRTRADCSLVVRMRATSAPANHCDTDTSPW